MYRIFFFNFNPPTSQLTLLKLLLLLLLLHCCWDFTTQVLYPKTTLLCQPLLLSQSLPTPFLTRFLRVFRSFLSYSTCRLLYRGILEVEAGDCRHLPIWQLNLVLMGIRVA